MTTVSRIEVINHAKGGTGRDYVYWVNPVDFMTGDPKDQQHFVNVDFVFQDEGQTLKIFVRDAPKV